MRLEPVYLLAPKPSSTSTRRAFLTASATFAVGIGLGGACGYAAGSRATRANVQPLDGDDEAVVAPELKELRRLAIVAPIEELIENRHAFLNVLITNYPKDKDAWRGVGRLTQAALQRMPIPDLRAFARYLSQVIEHGDPIATQAHRQHIQALRQLR